MSLLATIILSLVSFISCENMTQDLSEYLSVGYSRGRLGDRVTELSLVVRDEDMLAMTGVSVDRVRLEVRTGDGCWTRVEDRPMRRGKDKTMWRKKIIPCNTYYVRLGVERDDCIEYHDYHTPVGPASKEDITRSHFRPARPDKMRVNSVDNTTVQVTWSHSACADHYDVWYEAHDGRDSANISLPQGQTAVTLTNLLNYTDYTVYVTAIMGEEFSDEAEVDFTTGETIDDNDNDDDSNTIDTVCHNVDKECGIQEVPVVMDQKIEESRDDRDVAKMMGKDISTERHVYLNHETQSQKSGAVPRCGKLFFVFVAQVAFYFSL